MDILEVILYLKNILFSSMKMIFHLFIYILIVPQILDHKCILKPQVTNLYVIINQQLLKI